MSATKDIIECEKKMAAFMGWKQQLNANERWYGAWFDQRGNRKAWSEFQGHEPLLFHEEYEWLMELVEKIETFTFEDEKGVLYAFNVIIEGKTCTIERAEYITHGDCFFLRQKADSKKAAIFIACCAFIEWYNDFIKSFNKV